MKYLIVGDIHGHFEVLERAINYASKHGYEFIQVGDLTDSFTRTNKDQQKCLELARDASQDDDKTFLLGNHDLSYMFPEYYACSGFTRNRHGLFIDTYHEIEFDHAISFSDVLVTHAGISRGHLDYLFNVEGIEDTGDDIDSVLSYINEAIENGDHIFKAGWASGGPLEYGGIFWGRPIKFEPIGDITQVFGHTKQREVHVDHEKQYYNIDTIETGDQSILSWEDGTFIIKKHYMD